LLNGSSGLFVDRFAGGLSPKKFGKKEGSMPLRVLLVQSDVHAAHPLERFFKERGDEIWIVDDIAQGMTLLTTWQPEVMLLDLHFAGNEWLGLLRQARQSATPVKIILTNKYPDLQRELMAGEYGATVFLRQPYTQRWIEAALQRVTASGEGQPPRERKAQLPQVRFPVRIKITAPYLLLAVLFALASAYVITQVILESVQDRYLNQLIETGRQVSDWMVREEDRLLGTERLISNSQGLAKFIIAQDAEGVRSVAFPLGVNAGEEAVEIVDLQGITLLSMHHVPNGGVGDYEFSKGDPIFGQQPFVRNILLGQTDAVGDKYAGLVQAGWGNYFYVAGPVYDESGQVVGAVLVGRSLTTLARESGKDNLADITFYDFQGQKLASSFTCDASTALSEAQIFQVLRDQASASLTRTLQATADNYAEILGPWQARDKQDLGLVGTALPQQFLVRTSSGVQLQVFVLVAAAIVLVVIVGLFLANLITRPLARLVEASSAVAQGNLEIKVDSTGNDEMAVLAHSFNYMVAGLQEGSVYRDLLGRTVSPEVRDQLRQTFNSGNLRLEGQEAVATVLMTDIRSFTTLSERSDPSTVLTWLNEYFGRLVPIIQANGGVVNKFDGDAMLAFFGILPRRQSPKNGARAACLAAMEMLQVIEQLNRERMGRGDPPFVTGIGINTGVVIAGGLGTSDRLHYTIIGDTVNTTQRLESLTRQMFAGSGAVIGHSTYLALAEYTAKFNLEPAGMFAIKGKSDQLLIYRMSLAHTQPARSVEAMA
jgi:class 3 adenylate cyclase/ActR/RegA family two-component response regulator